MISEAERCMRAPEGTESSWELREGAENSDLALSMSLPKWGRVGGGKEEEEI